MRRQLARASIQFENFTGNNSAKVRRRSYCEGWIRRGGWRAILRRNRKPRDETPKTKIHTPEKLQAPNFQRHLRVLVMSGVWCLVFLWSLELGFWSFGGCAGPPEHRLHPRRRPRHQ